MDWKKQFDIHKKASPGMLICVIFMIAILVFLLLAPRYSRNLGRSFRCFTNMKAFPDYMAHTAEEMEPEDLAKMTVADLLQESIRKGKMKENQVVCPIDGRPYDIFPLSAAGFVRRFESGNQDPIPVAMCRSLHEKREGWSGWYKIYYGTPVVYTDGQMKYLSRDEAEKLISELSPKPIDFP